MHKKLLLAVGALVGLTILAVATNFPVKDQGAASLQSPIADKVLPEQRSQSATTSSATEKVFLMGGAQGYVPSGHSNDIWSTSDMITWTQISPNAPNPQKWSQRTTYGFGSSVYFNNKIWIMGGQSSSANLVGDVWSSADGINWNLATSSPPWGQRIVQPVVFNNKLWIISSIGNGIVYGDIWSSPDGINWTQVVVSAPWIAKGLTNPVVFNNKLWIMGGWNGQPGPASSNDVWSSPDGINWTQVTASAPWSVRYGHSTLVYNNKIWVIGGKDAFVSSGFFNDVWSSPDGINWTQTTANAPWNGRFGHTALVFNGNMYVIAGSNNSVNFTNQVWSSSNGITWTQVTASAPWLARYFHQTVVTPLSFGQIPNPIVTTNTPTFVATTTAQINGFENPNGGAPTAMWFKWGTNSGSLTNTTTFQSANMAQTFSANLSGLTPGTTYYFQACAQNNGGTTVCGSILSFTTALLLPDLVLTDLRWSSTLNGTYSNTNIPPIPVCSNPTMPHVYFIATVKNIGTAPATLLPVGSSGTLFNLYGGINNPTTLYGGTFVPNAMTLAPGASYTHKFSSSQIPNLCATAGTYHMNLIVDTTNHITESNETNNNIQKNLVVQ